ncbi:MAG: hypothetical protein AAB772_00395 [Patescibacteria group bacterium]
MNTFDKIKITLTKGSGKCVVLQNEEPKYVVMTWQEYEKLNNLINVLKNKEELDINEIPV